MHVREVTGDSVSVLKKEYSAEEIAQWYLISSLEEARHAEHTVLLAYSAAGMYDKKFKVVDALSEGHKARKTHADTLKWLR